MPQVPTLHLSLPTSGYSAGDKVIIRSGLHYGCPAVFERMTAKRFVVRITGGVGPVGTSVKVRAVQPVYDEKLFG
jgi:hypothetical protein